MTTATSAMMSAMTMTMTRTTTLLAMLVLLAVPCVASAHPAENELDAEVYERDGDDEQLRGDDRAREDSARDLQGDDEAWASAGTHAASGVPEPVAIADLLAAAYAAANLDRDLSRSWRRRARVAGLVPWVSVRVGWDASWDEHSTDIDRGRVFDVRATWRLDRLVFDGRELQASSVELARRRERRRLAREVVRVYFAWQRAAARGRGAAAAARLDELTAELDALTDGWFSEMQDRARRSASETRTHRR